MPDLTVDLAGKGIIVTGVGGSIALGCALARGGVSLTLNDVDPQALERIVSRMPQMGVPVLSLVGDVSNPAAHHLLSQSRNAPCRKEQRRAIVCHARRSGKRSLKRHGSCMVSKPEIRR